MGAHPGFSGPLASSDDPTYTAPRPAAPALSPSFPATIGRYRIIRLLGAGGMGTVYEAEQDHPRRKVALKVLKYGLTSPDVLWRFEQEAEVLGRLQHPGIARIYEAGQAEIGGGAQPYFAMELIHGVPLLEYAEAHHLKTRQWLELMVKISEAVQHAHQLGIIHRDLKPANILVEESGQPKILDFGVARVIDREVHTTPQTEVGQIVGTLAYMSPEQVSGDPLAVDTRSDVYALGVIFYELLTGCLPYKISRHLPEAVQTIWEEEPTCLSSVNRTYRGDIETIVGKALEKEKARRYASAAELAADIGRYLKDEPITARPPSTTYQMQKFARRHRGLVAGVAAVFVVLVAGIVVSTWETTRALQAEATAKAVNDFLRNDLLAQASANTQARPDTKPDPDLKVRTVLDRAAAHITGEFKKQPLVEASIRQTIGDTYQDLGLYPEAQRQLERALNLQRRVIGEQHPDTLTSMNSLAELYYLQGKYAQAEPLYTKVLEVRRRVLGEEHPATLNSMQGLAVLYTRRGKYAQAEPLYTKVLEVRRRVLGEEHPATLNSMQGLAVLYTREGKYAQAEPLFTKALEVRRRVLGEEHPATLSGMEDLAVLYRDQGKYAQAEPLFTRVLEIEPHVLGEEHPDTLSSMEGLAAAYWYEGKYAQAEPLFKKALKVSQRVLGEEHPDTLVEMNSLASTFVKEGKYVQAEPLFTKALEVRRRVLGEEHPDTLSGMQGLAVLYRDQGKYAQAEPLFTRLLEVRRRVLGEEHPATLSGMEDLAVLYRDQGKYAQAEPLFTRVLEIEPHVLGPAHPDTLRHINDLALMYVNTGQYAQAEQWLREALPRYQTARKPTWEQNYCQSLLGVSLVGQKKYAEAEPLLLSGYQGMLQQATTVSWKRRSALKYGAKWIVQLYQAWGKPEKAAEWRDKLQRISF